MSVKEGLEEISQTSVANILEVGSRVLLKSRTEDFQIPEGADVREDLAAAIASSLRKRALKEGIK